MKEDRGQQTLIKAQGCGPRVRSQEGLEAGSQAWTRDREWVVTSELWSTQSGRICGEKKSESRDRATHGVGKSKEKDQKFKAMIRNQKRLGIEEFGKKESKRCGLSALWAVCCWWVWDAEPWMGFARNLRLSQSGGSWLSEERGSSWPGAVDPGGPLCHGWQQGKPGQERSSPWGQRVRKVNGGAPVSPLCPAEEQRVSAGSFGAGKRWKVSPGQKGKESGKRGLARHTEVCLLVLCSGPRACRAWMTQSRNPVTEDSSTLQRTRASYLKPVKLVLRLVFSVV